MKAILLTIFSLMMVACSPVMATGAVGTQSMTSTAIISFFVIMAAIMYLLSTVLFHILARVTGMRKPSRKLQFDAKHIQGATRPFLAFKNRF